MYKKYSNFQLAIEQTRWFESNDKAAAVSNRGDFVVWEIAGIPKVMTMEKRLSCKHAIAAVMKILYT